VSLSLVFGVHSKTKAQSKVELFSLLSGWSKLQDTGEIISVLSVPVKNVPTTFFLLYLAICAQDKHRNICKVSCKVVVKIL